METIVIWLRLNVQRAWGAEMKTKSRAQALINAANAV